MATSEEYFLFIKEQLNQAQDVAYRKMMEEYLIYCKGRVVGGIYDNRLLIKNVNSARELMPDARLERPYENGKEMLLVEEIENKDFLAKLFNIAAEEIPLPKAKKKK